MAVCFIGVLLSPLIVEVARTNSLHLQSQQMPSYAGFASINSNKNHFILLGDTQSTSIWESWRERNERERKLIIDEITKRGPAFVIHLGDLTSYGSSKKQWQQFDDAHKEFGAKKIPYFPILGNHEFYGNGQRALQNYYGRFPHLSERWYSFRWKSIGFILVDSNFSHLAMEEDEEQRRWYVAELKKFERDELIGHVIVCCHEPPFTNSRVIRPNEKVKTFFADPFLDYNKTSLFFSGHNHSYERFQIGGKLFVVSGGGGGPRHKVSINPKKRRYEDLFNGCELRFLHFIEIEIVGSQLAYRVVRLNPDYTFTVTDALVWRLGRPLTRTIGSQTATFNRAKRRVAHSNRWNTGHV